MTVRRAGADTTRRWPAVGLIRFRGLQVFGPLHGLPAPTRVQCARPGRPPAALRPRPSATPTPTKPPAIRPSDEPVCPPKHYLIPVLNKGSWYDDLMPKNNSISNPKPIRNARGQLLPGVILNPKGRPRGAYGRRMRAFQHIAELLENISRDEPQAPAAQN